MEKAPGCAVIPTRCDKFLALCFTLGIDLEKQTGGISNAYSKGVTYDPGEPGTISYFLSDGGINPLAIAAVWQNPEKDLAEAMALPQRLLKCRDAQEWARIADDIDALHVWGAVAHIRHFTQGKFSIDSKSVSDAEDRAAQVLSDMGDAMRRDAERRNGGAYAAKLSECWNPAMFAWVKAWISNYLEVRDLWEHATPSVKIEREDGMFPIIIPKGKDFARLVKRWVG
jgi:hypothetical protein